MPTYLPCPPLCRLLSYLPCPYLRRLPHLAAWCAVHCGGWEREDQEAGAQPRGLHGALMLLRECENG